MMEGTICLQDRELQQLLGKESLLKPCQQPLKRNKTAGHLPHIGAVATSSCHCETGTIAWLWWQLGQHPGRLLCLPLVMLLNHYIPILSRPRCPLSYIIFTGFFLGTAINTWFHGRMTVLLNSLKHYPQWRCVGDARGCICTP